jgi:hypothetical protein
LDVDDFIWRELPAWSAAGSIDERAPEKRMPERWIAQHIPDSPGNQNTKFP